MRVPFLDLRAQDAVIGAEVRAAIAEVLASQQFILGPHVERFEAAMAAYCGVRHAIGVASGTDALADAAAAALERVGDTAVGLLPVHLFGRLASMPALRLLAERHGLWILEDAAQ